MDYVKKNTDKRCIVDVLLPGYKPKDIKVIACPDENIKAGAILDEMPLVVKAKMKTDSENNRSLGYYKRQPKKDKAVIGIDKRFDVENASVSFDNGVVRIDIPKREEYLGVVLHPGDAPDDIESEE